MDTRAERVGRNEAIFREINERLNGLNETFAVITQTFAVVCECGDRACVDQLELPTAVYERARQDPALFVVAPGHDDPSVETVVERRDAWAIVRKHPGDPEDLAAALDPRA